MEAPSTRYSRIRSQAAWAEFPAPPCGLGVAQPPERPGQLFDIVLAARCNGPRVTRPSVRRPLLHDGCEWLQEQWRLRCFGPTVRQEPSCARSRVAAFEERWSVRRLSPTRYGLAGSWASAVPPSAAT